jgi:hypothetical protein
MSARDSMAVDGKGRPLAFSPSEVDEIVRKALDSGELIAVVLRHNDDLMVQVMGPPSAELRDALEEAARAYRAVLRNVT